MALSPAERSRRYRARKKRAEGAPLAVVGRPWGNGNAVRHGAYGADVAEAAAGRLAERPAYLDLPVFRQALVIAQRRLEMADRVAAWVEAMGEGALVPPKAGSSPPIEVLRQHDAAAMAALAAIGMTPRSAAAFGRMLEDKQKPDLAQLAAQMRLEGWAEDDEGA